MEHESTQLTKAKRQTLAEIERNLSRWPRRSSRWRRSSCWLGSILGTALLTGGLWSGSAVVAAIGFTALVLSLSAAIGSIEPARIVRGLRAWLRYGPAPPPSSR